MNVIFDTDILNSRISSFISSKIKEFHTLADGEIFKIDADTYALNPKTNEWLKNTWSRKPQYPSPLSIKFQTIEQLENKLSEYLIDDSIIAYFYLLKPLADKEILNYFSNIYLEFSVYLIKIGE